VRWRWQFFGLEIQELEMSSGVTGSAEQDRRLLAKALFKLFDEWELSERDQALLLGLDAHDLDVLTSMRAAGALASSMQLVERGRSLLRIYRYLSMLYPEHPHLRRKWITSAHPRLNGQAPLQRMKEGGGAGIRFVTLLLEEHLF